MYDGVPSLSLTEEPRLLPLSRFREFRRTVIDEATGLSLTTDPERGEPREDVSDGAGSLDLADWTRSSSFCILPIRPRIWNSEPDLGSPGGREVFVLVKLLRDEIDIDGVERPLLYAPLL
jgi:hypothetical protein